MPRYPQCGMGQQALDLGEPTEQQTDRCLDDPVLGRHPLQPLQPVLREPVRFGWVPLALGEICTPSPHFVDASPFSLGQRACPAIRRAIPHNKTQIVNI